MNQGNMGLFMVHGILGLQTTNCHGRLVSKQTSLAHEVHNMAECLPPTAC